MSDLHNAAEKIPLDSPADKAIKDAIRMMDGAYSLIRTAGMATLKFEDDGGSSIEDTLEMAVEKIAGAEAKLRELLAAPYRMGGAS